MWFIGVEVGQETSASPPKKNPGSLLHDVYHSTEWISQHSCQRQNFQKAERNFFFV